MKKHRYSSEEKQFIRENLRKYDSYTDFCKVFNAHFGTNVTRSQLSDLCTKRLGFPIAKNKTKFQKGHRDKELPIGTIRKTQNGSAYIKVKNTLSHFSGYREPDWLPLQKKIWMDEHGPVPDGCMICFLDCNQNNFSLNNLYCINRKISVRLSQNGWWSKDPDITLAGIKYAELLIELKKDRRPTNDAGRSN